MGGRQVCVGPEYGDQFDHHAVVFQYANGIRMFGYTRDILNCYNEVSDVILGTKGRALLPDRPRIEGENPWRYAGPRRSMYDTEHKELFEAIRAGKALQNGDYMFTSSMLAVMAQMACYTGQKITWDQAMKSKASFALPRYGWDIAPPVHPSPNGQYPTAMPGITKFRR